MSYIKAKNQKLVLIKIIKLRKQQELDHQKDKLSKSAKMMNYHKKEKYRCNKYMIQQKKINKNL